MNPLTEDDKKRGAIKKIAHRGYTAIITADFGYIVDDKHGVTVASDLDGIDEEMAVLCACETIDEIVDRPKMALKRLKECDTDRLVNLFYEYAISAPTWACELMDMVDENKKRDWLIGKITDMLSESELIDEMGA